MTNMMIFFKPGKGAFLVGFKPIIHVCKASLNAKCFCKYEFYKFFKHADFVDLTCNF